MDPRRLERYLCHRPRYFPVRNICMVFDRCLRERLASY